MKRYVCKLCGPIVEVYRHSDGKDYHSIGRDVRTPLYEGANGEPVRHDTGKPLLHPDHGQRVHAEGHEVDVTETLKHPMISVEE